MSNADSTQIDNHSNTAVYYAERKPEVLRCDLRTEFFPVANPSSQLLACINILDSFENFQMDGVTHNGLHRWKELLIQLTHHTNELDNDPETAKFFVDATVLLLDISKVDLISPVNNSSLVGAKGSYSRGSWRDDFFRNQSWADELGGIHTMSVREAELLYATIDQSNIISSVDQVEAPEENSEDIQPTIYFWDHAVRASDIAKIKKEFTRRCYEKKVVIQIPIRYGDLVILGQLDPLDTNSSWKVSIFDPLSSVPVQDVWAEGLRRGLSFSDTQGTLISQEPKSTISYNAAKEALLTFVVHESPDMFVEKRRLFRKHKAYLESRPNLRQVENDITSYYKNEFAVNSPEGMDPSVIITRSGVSANETALLAGLAEIRQQQPGADTIGVYMHTGWYFENASSRVFFDKRVGYAPEDQSQIICINNNPSNPFPGGNVAYQESVQKILDRTIERALNYKDKHFVVVYDKTSDLNVSIFSRFGVTIPPNISVMETTSLTKHQRGDTNGFYGALFHWGNLDREQLLDLRSRAFGDPTRYTLESFPFINSGDVERTIQHNMELSHAIESVLQGDKSDDESWHVETYGYFTYISPPWKPIWEEILQEQQIKMGFINVNGSHKQYEDLTADDKAVLLQDKKMRNRIGRRIDDHIATFLYEGDEINNQSTYPTITFGDSFGLRESRLSSLSFPYYIEGKLVEDMNFLRFTFGSDTTSEEIQNFFTNMLTSYEKDKTKSQQKYANNRSTS